MSGKKDKNKVDPADKKPKPSASAANTNEDCGLVAGARLATSRVRSHAEGVLWRFHSDGYAPALEQVERADGMSVQWIKHPETPGGPSGAIVKVRGKVVYIFMPQPGSCGVATPDPKSAQTVPCPPHSERTSMERMATNDTFYKCLGVDPFGDPIES